MRLWAHMNVDFLDVCAGFALPFINTACTDLYQHRLHCPLSTPLALTIKERVLAMTAQLEQSFQNIERLRQLIPSLGKPWLGVRVCRERGEFVRWNVYAQVREIKRMRMCCLYCR